MKNQDAIKILREYNQWRRHEGEPYQFPYSGKELGQAVDIGIEAISKYGSFDWLAYKAQVAATMLPVIYPSISKSNSGLRNANDVAIDETISLAIEMAERLEKRLKGIKK